MTNKPFNQSENVDLSIQPQQHATKDFSEVQHHVSSRYANEIVDTIGKPALKEKIVELLYEGGTEEEYEEFVELAESEAKGGRIANFLTSMKEAMLQSEGEPNENFLERFLYLWDFAWNNEASMQQVAAWIKPENLLVSHFKLENKYLLHSMLNNQLANENFELRSPHYRVAVKALAELFQNFASSQPQKLSFIMVSLQMNILLEDADSADALLEANIDEMLLHPQNTIEAWNALFTHSDFGYPFFEESELSSFIVKHARNYEELKTFAALTPIGMELVDTFRSDLFSSPEQIKDIAAVIAAIEGNLLEELYNEMSKHAQKFGVQAYQDVVAYLATLR